MNSLDDVLKALLDEDSMRLRELAGLFGDEAAISQDRVAIELALICYCFHKIFTKLHFREKNNEIVMSAIAKLKEGEYESLLSDISEFDEKHGLMEGLVGKARIKIAARLHSRGISVTQSASITGAKLSDLFDYVGGTKDYHNHTSGKPLSERLNTARDIFNHTK
ncbi:MAG: hypothetical protein KKD39_01595 [Candidatus Altiarchaeota archaeon]|nr:hypothetical protein [Candidatus Altiarchaeota archaeon]